MAVMHLRLEHQNTMVVAATPVQSSTDKVSSPETAIVAASSSGDQAGEGDDTSSDAAGAVEARPSVDSNADELHRLPSMNLATDPKLWVGDATLSPGNPCRRISDGGGGINPFDSSSEEEEDDDGAAQVRIGAWRGDAEGGDLDTSLEEPGKRSLAKGSNPFDFSFLDGNESAAADATACSGDQGIESIPSGEAAPMSTAFFPDTNTALSGSQSPRMSEMFPVGQIVPAIVATPSSAGAASAAAQVIAWPANVDISTPRNTDQLLLTSGAPPRAQTLNLAPVDSPSTTATLPASPIDSPGMPLASFADASPLPFSPSPTTTAAEFGVAEAPRQKCLPPTPLLGCGTEGTSSSPYPTLPVAPFVVPSGKTPADVRDRADALSPGAAQEPGGLFSSAFGGTTEAAPPALDEEQARLFSAFRDRAETPASPNPSKEQMDLHLAFRDITPEASSPPETVPLPALPQSGSLQPQQPQQPALPEPRGLLDEAESRKRLQNFNPFGRPGSFVLSQTPSQHPREETATPPETVRRSS